MLIRLLVPVLIIGALSGCTMPSHESLVVISTESKPVMISPESGIVATGASSSTGSTIRVLGNLK